MADCKTIVALKNIARSSHDAGLSLCAERILAIIQDTAEESMTDYDLESLSSLVDAVFSESHLEVLDHLKDGVPDCEVCAALHRKMNSI